MPKVIGIGIAVVFTMILLVQANSRAAKFAPGGSDWIGKQAPELA